MVALASLWSLDIFQAHLLFVKYGFKFLCVLHVCMCVQIFLTDTPLYFLLSCVHNFLPYIMIVTVNTRKICGHRHSSCLFSFALSQFLCTWVPKCFGNFLRNFRWHNMLQRVEMVKLPSTMLTNVSGTHCHFQLFRKIRELEIDN